MKRFLFLLITLLFLAPMLFSQSLDNEAIKTNIEQYKIDARGPYKDIRWFCKDGSIIMPKEKCPTSGGVQRARYRNEVEALGKSNHIFLGQILANTSKEDFWDKANYNSRLKQYQLEKYLRSIDDGWVLQKGQYYRGAFQVEDEEAWGIDFFDWLLKDAAVLENQFFLTRQAVKDIPHKGDDSKTLNVRALSRNIADAYPAFNMLRVKIHGQPEAADIAKVRAFREEHNAKLNSELRKKFDDLLADMTEVYQPVNLLTLQVFLRKIPKELPIAQSLNDYIELFSDEKNHIARTMATAEKLAEIRIALSTVKTPKARLALLDFSNAIEEIFFTEISKWNPATIREMTDKICYTSLAAMGTGFVELWEWEKLLNTLSIGDQKEMTLAELNAYLIQATSLIEWGTGMVHGVYKDVIDLYGGFEPMAYGFFDDRIRGSVLLELGNSVGDLGNFLTQKSKLTNKVMDLQNQVTIRGLNPGFAMGELVVINELKENVEISKDKIYVFYNPPADLKPVAGILTVTEGNMVSHVQLLARNLGIPNGVLSAANLDGLKRHSGKKVFYAVSNQGTVIMKAVEDMTEIEQALFAEKKRVEERITVPVEKIDLEQTTVINMRHVNASHSGKICGPKAANLGQLKLMFPDNVVEGLVLPFGVFRQHFDQQMPNQKGTYWEFLNEIFTEADNRLKRGEEENAIENYVLSQLGILREAIKKMELLPAFIADLEQSFRTTFDQEIGEIPVFLRSDTNMEDLKNFTGAGLNLTLFNIVERAKILQGIKDVWASPYTERSFKWRQRYLLNPENVFPSILIIPSVDVEYSGVLITKGIPTNDGRDLTIAFSRGAGGAVDGQAAESYLLEHQAENRLLAPAREPEYRRLPNTGGSKMNFTTFEKPILNAQNLYDLRWLAYNIHQEIPKATTADNQGPFDVELGFQDDKIWLFQIRPFVENKNATSSAYLESISPKINGSEKILLDQKIM